MNLRLITSKDTEKRIVELQSLLRLSTKAAVIRIAVGLSLKKEGDPRVELVKDNSSKGGDYQRHTLTGDDDNLFKALIIQHLGENIDDNEYFPNLFNAHLERGINLLHNEYKMAGNNEKLFENLLRDI